MAQTPNILLTLLQVGQKEKEATINTNFQIIDGKVLKYLGELPADPASGPLPGSTYFNTSTDKLKVLKTTNVWVNVA